MLVGQVVDDRTVGLETAQDERAGGPFEARRGVFVAVALDGLKVAALELGLGAQQAGVQELHDGPEVTDVVFDGRAREGDAVVGFQAAGSSGLLGEMVLDVLCLIEDDAAPRDGGQVVLVPVQGAVAGDHHLVVGRQSADQYSQVPYELVVHSLRRYAHRMIEVGCLPTEFESPVTLQRSRDGVQVNHHLDDVAGALLPGLHVDDDRLAVPLRDQVGLAGQRC